MGRSLVNSAFVPLVHFLLFGAAYAEPMVVLVVELGPIAERMLGQFRYIFGLGGVTNGTGVGLDSNVFVGSRSGNLTFVPGMGFFAFRFATVAGLIMIFRITVTGQPFCFGVRVCAGFYGVGRILGCRASVVGACEMLCTSRSTGGFVGNGARIPDVSGCRNGFGLFAIADGANGIGSAVFRAGCGGGTRFVYFPVVRFLLFTSSSTAIARLIMRIEITVTKLPRGVYIGVCARFYGVGFRLGFRAFGTLEDLCTSRSTGGFDVNGTFVPDVSGCRNHKFHIVRHRFFARSIPEFRAALAAYVVCLGAISRTGGRLFCNKIECVLALRGFYGNGAVDKCEIDIVHIHIQNSIGDR